MSPITTHVLDTALGKPASGVPISLSRVAADGSACELARGHTDADGRLRDLLAPGSLQRGRYRMRFELEAYFAASGRTSLYPVIEVVFEVSAQDEHYHIPLLLSPYGYSTYRGS
jgi:5-hydroxyisourate hydrolase